MADSDTRSKMARSADTLPGAIGEWLMAHPKALREVKLWMEMARKGETDWTLRRHHEELQSAYGFPFRTTYHFGRFLSQNFPDEYPRKR